MADLITPEYLAAALADSGLSTAQLADLPARAAEASRLVRDWCNRRFSRATYDHVFTHDVRRPLLLREYPVNGVERVSVNPTAVFTVTQADTATNQRASAALATSGSSDAGLVVTGLKLSRTASGVTTAPTLLFSASATLDALQAAVAALGAGWAATVADGYGKWPTADLRAVQGGMPALGPKAAEFRIHADDVPFDLDDGAGLLVLGASSELALEGARWGGPMFADDGAGLIAPGPNNVRVIYDAGYDAIPEAVQLACVELVKAAVERLRTDSSLKSESDGTYSWTARDLVETLPPGLLQALALYRSTRA